MIVPHLPLAEQVLVCQPEQEEAQAEYLNQELKQKDIETLWTNFKKACQVFILFPLD